MATHRTPTAATISTDPATPQQLPQLLDRATIAIEALRTQWRTVAHLGTHERMALSQLQTHGAMPMSELASRISLSRAAVTSLVDRLEAEQWVQRSGDERDRRRTVVSLDERARDTMIEIEHDFQEDLTAFAASMSSTQLEAIAEFLEHIARVAEQHADALRATAAERSLE